MCFSPEASFAGGIIISSIGVATYKKVHNPSQLLFATIPVFFGIQQIVEGTLWLVIPNPEYINIQIFSKYLFLVMADVLWPVMIPLSGLLMFLSCLVTAIFFTQYLTSVWCFFAAIISGVVFWILSDSMRSFILEKLVLLKPGANK